MARAEAVVVAAAAVADTGPAAGGRSFSPRLQAKLPREIDAP